MIIQQLMSCLLEGPSLSRHWFLRAQQTSLGFLSSFRQVPPPIPTLEESEDACHRAAGEREGVWEVKELLTCQHLEAELWGSTHAGIWLPRPAHTQKALAAERMYSFP